MRKPALYANVLEIADKALSSEKGIEVACDTPRHATNLRARFYAEREKLYDTGERKYDRLSIRIKQNKIVVFEKRDATVNYGITEVTPI